MAIGFPLESSVPETRTVNGHALTSDVTVTKSDVGLGNCDNTSDANKPVSSAQQTALDLKAPLASPTFTGTVILPSGTVTEAMQVTADNTTNDVSITKHGYAPKAPNDATKFLDGTGAWAVPAGGVSDYMTVLSAIKDALANNSTTGIDQKFTSGSYIGLVHVRRGQNWTTPTNAVHTTTGTTTIVEYSGVVSINHAEDSPNRYARLWNNTDSNEAIDAGSFDATSSTFSVGSDASGNVIASQLTGKVLQLQVGSSAGVDRVVGAYCILKTN